MASTPTARNGFDRQGTGDNPGGWGAVLNSRGLDLIDEALDGITTVAVASDITLSANDYVPNQVRRRVLKLTGAGGFSVIIRGVEKAYIVHNACANSVTIKTASGGGIVVASGQVTFFYCDGVNCWAATNTGSSTFLATVVGPAASTGRASFRAPHGTSPTSPLDGDIWTTAGGGLKFRISGLTLGPAAVLILSGAATALPGVATIDLALSGSFRAYELLYQNIRPEVIGQTLMLRLSVDGGATYKGGAADYKYAYSTANSAGTVFSDGGTGGGVVLGADLRTNSDPSASGMMRVTIENPHNTTFYKMISYESVYEERVSGQLVRINGAGKLVTGGLGNVTHVRLVPTGGRLFGSFAVYGIG